MDTEPAHLLSLRPRVFAPLRFIREFSAIIAEKFPLNSAYFHPVPLDSA
ncbi:MAG TPA: hypothetical protein VG754_05905 [Verrucomicrobiae bacterium]|nr:hypothetical protein [Verrucomicrobiae bacterium]